MSFVQVDDFAQILIYYIPTRRRKNMKKLKRFIVLVDGLVCECDVVGDMSSLVCV